MSVVLTPGQVYVEHHPEEEWETVSKRAHFYASLLGAEILIGPPRATHSFALFSGPADPLMLAFPVSREVRKP
jgi:hypothetical protein